MTTLINNRVPDGLRPLNKNLLVRQLPAETKTAGGLVIPDAAQEKHSGRGTVVAMAPAASKQLSPDEWDKAVKVGSVVVFQRYAGTRVAGTEDMLVLEADEVLGVFAPEPEKD